MLAASRTAAATLARLKRISRSAWPTARAYSRAMIHMRDSRVDRSAIETVGPVRLRPQ